MRQLLLLSYLLLVACDTSNPTSTSTKEAPLNPLTEAKASMAFTCVHEQIPAPSAETDVLFKYARWLQKNNQLKQNEAVDMQIERLYRVASENGHYKANINLQNGAMRGTFKLRGEEHLRMSEQLINAGVATGYYFVGMFLQNGGAGLQKDHETALRYYRKAADQGSALAQFHVGDKIEPIDIAPKIALQMYRCAAEQGNGEAATSLGVYLSEVGQYQEALEAFQLGVAAGDETAAGFLDDGFRGPEPTDKLDYLGQLEDLERADRYENIWKILSGYSYANPKVPEINEIVPLPPAELPAWDGKLQWLEERLANVPPEKPSEALIHQLARAKVLDPATGRPMPGSSAFIQIDYIKRPTCNSGKACTHTGYWLADSIAGQSGVRLEQGEPRRFEKGEIMPTLNVRHRHSRFLLADRVTVEEENIEWRLLGEA
jgi:tetratricopeptide (TPR) repeat protein